MPEDPSLSQALGKVLEELRVCVRELEAVVSSPHQSGASRPSEPSNRPNLVPSLAVRRLAVCLAELLNLSALSVGGNNLCEVVDCPQWPAHLSLFRDVIEVLRETKRRFKSKELAELRQRVAAHLGISAQ